jgi:hypothetical protein
MPPVFIPELPLYPPQTISEEPAQTAELKYLAVGAFMVVIAVQESLEGLYLEPALVSGELFPPQMTISVPVQTDAGDDIAGGALVSLVATHESDNG